MEQLLFSSVDGLGEDDLGFLSTPNASSSSSTPDAFPFLLVPPTPDNNPAFSSPKHAEFTQMLSSYSIEADLDQLLANEQRLAEFAASTKGYPGQMLLPTMENPHASSSVTSSVFAETESPTSTASPPAVVDASNEKPDDSSPSEDSADSKKRKRILKGELTTIACEGCRSKHKKCDGKLPCFGCQRGKIECVYPEPRQRKSKPKPPKIRKTHPSAEAKNSSHISTLQISLNNMSDITTFIQSYRIHMEPYFGVPASFLPVTVFFDPNISDSIKFVMNCVLACGAIALGDRDRGDNFVENARQLLPSVFDISDLYTAGGFTLMSCYYFRTGQLDKMHSSISMSMSITEKLRHQYSSDPAFHWLYYTCLLHNLKTCKSRTKQLHKISKVLTDIIETERSLDVPAEQMYRFVMFKVMAICMKFVIISLISPTLEEYKRFAQVIDAIEKIVVNYTTGPLRDLNMAVPAMRALLFYRMGNFEAARSYAEAASDLLLQTTTQYLPLVFALNCCTFINYKLNNHFALQKNLKFGEEMKRYFPLITRFRDFILNSPSGSDEFFILIVGNIPITASPRETPPQSITQIEEISAVLRSIKIK